MERFWKNVRKTSGCWEWQAGKFRHGYGAFWLNGKNTKAHRFSWEQLIGPIPKGMSLCHKCDNPPCVNPDHLFIGTHRDNRMDCINKNRHNIPKGEAHYETKFSNNDIKKIRNSYKRGVVTQQTMADKYRVSRSLISMIINKVVWKHI